MDFLDDEKLKEEMEKAKSDKAHLQAVGAIGQAFVNNPTAFELLKGRKMDRPDIQGTMNNFAKNIEDPSERQAKLFQSFKQAKEAEEFKKKDEQEKVLKDPNSQASKAAKAMAAKYGIPFDANTTAYDLHQQFDPKKMREVEASSAIEFDKQKKLKQLEHQNQMEKTAYETAAKEAKKNDPKEKLNALGGTDKARYDNAKMVLKAIDDMGQALDKGDNTFSMIGDNNYTAAERKAAEAFGRMQSGGAINKDEEERFLAMLPRSKDNAQMQRKKLLDQRDEMISRLKTLGFSPEDAGYKISDFNYGKSEEEIFEPDVLEYAKKNGISPAQAQNIKLQRTGSKMVGGR